MDEKLKKIASVKPLRGNSMANKRPPEDGHRQGAVKKRS
jgi:hypothetical protein